MLGFRVKGRGGCGLRGLIGFRASGLEGLSGL